MRDPNRSDETPSLRTLAERCACTLARFSGRSQTPAPAAIAAHEAATIQWTQRQHLVDARGAARLARIGCGSCAAHTYAGASRALVQLGAELIAWLYLFDDAHGEQGDEAAFAAAVAVAGGAELPDRASPFLRALDDLCRRAAVRAGAGWRARFATALAFYFEGCRRELPYRASGLAPGLSVYREVKLRSVGVAPVFALLQIESGLDAVEARGAALAAIERDAMFLCAWVNDIFSFEKEQAEGDPLNLVHVLAVERGLDPAAAFDAAAALYREDHARFASGAAAFLDDASRSEAEHRYVRGMMTWVRGNLAWTVTSGRYGSPAVHAQAA